MRHRRCQRRKRGEALRPAQPRFSASAVGYVLGVYHASKNLPVADQRHDGTREDADAAAGIKRELFVVDAFLALEAVPEKPELIVTVHCVGYKLIPKETDA